MPDVTAPPAPPLGRIKGVEILHVGEWDISTGTTQVTLNGLRSMVAATACPAVRNATLKPGHKQPIMQGDPSIGYVTNLRVEDDYKLVGDWSAMPGWLVAQDANGDSVIAGAYADRSAEWRNPDNPYVCQLGHTHPWVLGAVALLGVEHPGIGTLESLHDLYSTPPTTAAAAAKEGPMPANAAAVSTDDVRRAYYDDAPWDEWIEEMQLDPLQLITVDDATGKHYRVPVTVTGDDAFAFGAKTEVRVQYVDAAVQAAAVAAGKRVLFASRAESRPNISPPDNGLGSKAAAGGPSTEGAGMTTTVDPVKLREALGLSADATPEQLSEAIASNNLVTATPAVAPADTDALVAARLAAAIEEKIKPWREQVSAATTELAQIKEDKAVDVKTRVFAAALEEGRLAPAERADWEARYDKAPDVITEILQARAKGSAVPVAASVNGYTGGDNAAGVLTADDEAYLKTLEGGHV